LTRISSLACTHFIDDLEEVLIEPGFPSMVERILLSKEEQSRPDTPYVVCASWSDIEERIFARG
jgi:hypothetical protein